MNISLTKTIRTKTVRTSFEEIIEESSVTIPEKSLFLSIISTLLEIVLRFEGHPVFKYSDYIKSVFEYQIQFLGTNIPEISPNLEFVTSFLKIITDQSAYPLNKRKNFLNIYLSKKDEVTETLSFFIQKILILSFPDENLKGQLDSFQISKHVADVCLDKVSEIYHLALVLVYEDGTVKQIIKYREKCPLAYFFVTNYGEVLELYTKSMIEIEKEPLMLSFLENKIVRGLDDLGKVGNESLNREANNAALESGRKIDMALQDLKTTVNINLKNSAVVRENIQVEEIKKVDPIRPGINLDSNRNPNMKPPPSLLNNAKVQENQIKSKINEENPIIINQPIENPLEKQRFPVASQGLPAEVVVYLNYITQVVSENKIFDRKLQEMTKSLVKNFPEIGKAPETLICSINENPNPAKPPAQEPLIVNNPENPPKDPKKICIFNSVAEPLDAFSDITCPTCQNSICNKCRIINVDSCVVCKRIYDDFEKNLLQVFSISLACANEEHKSIDIIPNYLNPNNIPARKFEAFRRCNKHMDMLSEEHFNPEFECAEACGICNFCRVSSPGRCERCNKPYNDNEKSVIELIRLSMENN